MPGGKFFRWIGLKGRDLKHALRFTLLNWTPHNKLPPDVSEIFYKLRAFVDSEYKDSSDSVRFVIFAAAYRAYCENKKYRMDVLRDGGEPENSRVIKTAYKEFDNIEVFRELCKGSTTIAKQYVVDDLKQTITSAIDEHDRNAWFHIRTHIYATIIVGLTLFSLPIFVAYADNKDAKELVNSFAHYLICKFPLSDSDRVFCTPIK